MERRLAVILAAVVLTTASATLVADSDGYYCAGPDYLAWETRGFHTDGVHRLHFLRLTADGPAPRSTVVLPDFQLHGMRCEADALTLYAFTAAHHVALDGHRMRLGDVNRPQAIADLRARWVPRRFGDTPLLRLGAVGGGTRYALVTDLDRVAYAAGAEYTTFTRLLRLTAADELIDSQVIFAESVAR